MKLFKISLLFLILVSSIVISEDFQGRYEIETLMEDGKLDFDIEEDFPVIVINETTSPKLDLYFNDQVLESLGDAYKEDFSERIDFVEKMNNAYGVKEFLSKNVNVKALVNGTPIYSAKWKIKDNEAKDDSLIITIIKVILIFSIVQCLIYSLLVILKKIKPWKLLLAAIQVILLLVVYISRVGVLF